MRWKKLVFTLVIILTASLSQAQPANPFGQVIQIYTHFDREIVGKPTWVLILRDVDTGQVLPYLYDVRDQDNFWIALSFGRNYRIVESLMKFYPSGRKIKNFCGIEDGILKERSLYITLTGRLSANRYSSNCQVMYSKGTNFYVVPPSS